MTVTQSGPITHPEISDALIHQWQAMLDLLAEMIRVPAALIIRIDHQSLTVVTKNLTIHDPYAIRDTTRLFDSGHYCEQLIRRNAPRLFEQILEEPLWRCRQHADGEMIRWLSFPIHWPDSEIFGAMCVLHNSSQHFIDQQHKLLQQIQAMIESHLELYYKNHLLELQNQQLKCLADTDDLTGIWNRRAFIVESNKELQRARRNNHAVCLLMMDIDDFKKINDIYGHEVGDEVLKLFTHCITATKRSYDIFGRIGGEEFALLLPETNRSEAMELAERIRKKVSEIFFHKHRSEIKITVCIGVYALARNDTSILAALSKADERLYAAKRAGKNKVIGYID